MKLIFKIFLLSTFATVAVFSTHEFSQENYTSTNQPSRMTYSREVINDIQNQVLAQINFNKTDGTSNYTLINVTEAWNLVR